MENMLMQLGDAIGITQLRAEISELRECLAGLQQQVYPVRLNQAEAARCLGYESPRALETLRRDGGGPRFQTQGKKIFYLTDDLREWARNQPAFENTGQAKNFLRDQ